jgi:hypothetical protein
LSSKYFIFPSSNEWWNLLTSIILHQLIKQPIPPILVAFPDACYSHSE